MKIKGIYIIYNTITFTTYIGSSFNIYRRWQYHKKDLKEQKHCNYRLQEDYNLTGIEAFQFRTIHRIFKKITLEKLLELEQKYINKALKNNIILYNIELKTDPKFYYKRKAKERRKRKKSRYPKS